MSTNFKKYQTLVQNSASGGTTQIGAVSSKSLLKQQAPFSQKLLVSPHNTTQ